MIEKVKRALLTMQRYSWEQGVAAQAFLELGETDTVVLMAKEAALRQREDGRLGVLGTIMRSLIQQLMVKLYCMLHKSLASPHFAQRRSGC
jgi:hypothetical protein